MQPKDSPLILIEAETFLIFLALAPSVDALKHRRVVMTGWSVIFFRQVSLDA